MKQTRFIKQRACCWLIRHFLPVNKKKIVFSQFGGKGYGCNPKAIADEFLRRDKDYDLVWLVNKHTDFSDAGLPEGVRGSHNALYDLLTAKVWINNIHFNVLIEKGLKKRPATIYLNTFHGGVTLKKEGTDKHSYDEAKELSQKDKMYLIDSDYVDYATLACDTEKHVLEEFFYGKCEIIKLGDARNDVLINGSSEVAKKVRDFYSIPDDTKIIIYAPTFRTDMKLDWYNLNYEEILEVLEQKYNCKWKMMIRLHPRLAARAGEIIPKSDKFINASDFLDMQDLLVAADMMISDYSSCATDFMLTRKPTFLYVPDLEYYIEHRGLYFEMDELPFPYAKTTDELKKCIEEYDAESYKQKTDAFIKHINYLDDGQSAKRIVDFLESKM